MLVFNLLLLLLLVFMNYNIYFLSFLIMMEYLIVVLLFFMLLINFNSWLYFIYLVYAVCEGVLGLSLLVSMNYEYGHQKISFINLY
uniref:NADH dehydrogenase subunit 4L n=1 Tax=Bombus hortorum TaxID=85660 RepID=A0A0S2LS98_BOMHO|nr:NADH dehydrogenase subunit 4L [Bombus hortorum]